MFLFSCLTGQVVLWWCSNFTSPVAVQLIENIPFYQTMAKIVIAHQGYGPDALSTLLVVFGLSSITTGLMFYAIGKAGFGKAVVRRYISIYIYIHCVLPFVEILYICMFVCLRFSFSFIV